MRIPVIVRWIFALAFCAPALWLSWWMIVEEPVTPGYGRDSEIIALGLLFPPVWSLFTVFFLRGRRILAPVQFATLSVMALIFMQVLILIWSTNLSAFLTGWLGRDPADRFSGSGLVFTLVASLGFLPMIYATYVALERLPRPLGLAHSR